MIEELYENSKAFKEYVTKYSTKHKVPPEEALTHLIVKNVAEDMSKKEKSHVISRV